MFSLIPLPRLCDPLVLLFLCDIASALVAPFFSAMLEYCSTTKPGTNKKRCPCCQAMPALLAAHHGIPRKFISSNFFVLSKPLVVLFRRQSRPLTKVISQGPKVVPQLPCILLVNNADCFPIDLPLHALAYEVCISCEQIGQCASRC